MVPTNAAGIVDSRYGIGIRSQLILPFLLLLAFPFLANFWLNNWTFTMLEQHRLQAVANASYLARSLEASKELLANIKLRSRVEGRRDLVADSIGDDKLLDGRDDDWVGTANEAFDVEDVVDISRTYNRESLSVGYKLGVSTDYLYLYLKVLDDHVVYREINNPSVHRNDHLQLGIVDPQGVYRKYTISAFQPARLSAHSVSGSGRSLRQEERIEAMWLATENGYNLELRIPLELVGDRFGFAIADVDDAEDRQIQYLIGSSIVDNESDLVNLIMPSTGIQRTIALVEHADIWLLDSKKRIVSHTRNQKTRDFGYELSWESGVIQFFSSLFPVSDTGSDNGHSKLEGIFQTADFISSALTGESGAVMGGDTTQTQSFTVAEPVYSDGEVVAAIVLQTSEVELLQYRDRVRDEMMVQFLLLLILGLIFWCILVWLQTSRLRALKYQLETAIDTRGRVLEKLPRSTVPDEIGDLSRSFSDMVTRLQQYNHYLESMASRLAHELRTPISIVRSSLDNIDVDQLDDENQVYVERAHDGLQRLSLILNNMSEATRLEQSLDMDDIVSFEFIQVVEGCVEGYKLAFPDARFALSVEAKSVPVTGLPDLIAQLFDKLIGNAVEFSFPETEIRIRLTIEEETAVLRVMNEGPGLPQDMRENLFDSMVSIRTEYDGTSSHLGLGLYIAKVITEFHGGDIKLSNREDSHGVVATVRIPLMRISSKLRL